jgi:hypothetical protein
MVVTIPSVFAAASISASDWAEAVVADSNATRLAVRASAVLIVMLVSSSVDRPRVTLARDKSVTLCARSCRLLV